MSHRSINRRTFLTQSALTISIAASLAMLGGCGFRLRGSDSLPTLAAFTLEGDTRSDVAQSLQTQLEASGAGVRENAPWRVTLSSPELSERRLGAAGRGSREHEFILSIQVSLQQRSNSAYALNSEHVSTSLRQRVNDDDLLNRDILVSEVRQQLSQQLAQRIIERLATLEVLRV